MEYTKCVEKLKELGIYDKWRLNIDMLKSQDSFQDFRRMDFPNFSSFINLSFTWENTNEGSDFWYELYLR